MANICLYKIKVIGKKLNCYKLIDMMPLYSYDKIILLEEGTEDNFTLIFSGDCKWSVGSYTKKVKGLKPYTEEEIKKINDGDDWEYCLRDKSILLDVEIFCNSKDIDGGGYAHFEHYDRGVKVSDECPKEIHIKKGRDYDTVRDICYNIDSESIEKSTFDKEGNKIENIYKVKFIDGYSYWYLGKDFKIGDLVFVKGAKASTFGMVKEIAKYGEHPAIYFITEKISHIQSIFKEEDIEHIWNSYKPKDRKTYLTSIVVNPGITKKRFISFMEDRWILFSKTNDDWNMFLDTLKI